MPFVLPDLPYAKDALDPHMSAETLDYHWGKHHKKYVDESNRLAKETGKTGLSLLDFIKQADKGPQFNNSAQLWNHSFFWQCLGPGGGRPSGELAKRIDNDRGDRPDRAKAWTAQHRQAPDLDGGRRKAHRPLYLQNWPQRSRR